VSAATRRNQEHVDAGRARFVHADIGDAAAALGAEPFDRTLASNVAALLDERAPANLAVVRQLLVPGGRLVVAMQLFDQRKANEVGDAAAAALTAAGFQVDRLAEPTGAAGPGIAVLATR
jgi:hypothetical protein